MHTRHAYLAALAFSLAAVAFLAAGCGGGSPSAAVASLTPSTTGTTTSADAGPAPDGSANGSSGSGGGVSMTMKTANGAKFAACMRSHGVPNFPDPNGQGAIEIGPSSGVNPDSPKFRAAQQACEKELPNGGQPTPQQQAKMQQKALEFSACMRKHGVTDFPDPTFSGGGAQLKLSGGRGSDLDPNSATFKAAQKACQGIMPKGGGTTTGGR